MLATGLKAQTDLTSLITNPSFESGFDGWVHKSLNTQGNNVFTLKTGNTYLEKWTGRGGAVGSASLSQQLSSLPPGNYELSVAAPQSRCNAASTSFAQAKDLPRKSI